jgi:hypothetical protein
MGFSAENSPLCGNQNTARAPLPRTLLQRQVQLRWCSLIFLSCPPELPLPKMEVQRGAPAVYYHQAGANWSAENPPRGNPGLKPTRMDGILKKII